MPQGMDCTTESDRRSAQTKKGEKGGPQPLSLISWQRQHSIHVRDTCLPQTLAQWQGHAIDYAGTVGQSDGLILVLNIKQHTMQYVQRANPVLLHINLLHSLIRHRANQTTFQINVWQPQEGCYCYLATTTADPTMWLQWKVASRPPISLNTQSPNMYICG